MRLVNNEDGQALVITTICMTILMGMAGMAIEIGMLYRTRQNVQIAADAAAEAAALDYHYNQSVTTAQTQGKAASTLNGFTDGQNGVTVTVNMPPTSGSVAGKSKYAEAIVTYPNPVSFMAFFGPGAVTVGARAVAGPASPGDACIWLMGTSGTDLALQGSYNIQTPDCGIYVNSPDSNAITVTGSGGTVNAAFLDAYGNTTPKHQTSPTPITNGVGARTPPISPSSPSSCSVTINPVTQLATAGVLTQTDISSLVSATNPPATVCFSSAVTISGTVNMPGGLASSSGSTGVVYVFQGGLTIATGATVSFGSCSGCSLTSSPPILDDPATLSGATIDLAGGTLTQNSSSILNVWAPTAGTYNGVGIMQPTTNPTSPLVIQFGSNNQVLDGWIYAPGVEVDLHDSGGGVTATGIVALSMTNQTSQLTIPGYDQYHTADAPDQIITLVE